MIVRILDFRDFYLTFRTVASGMTHFGIMTGMDPSEPSQGTQTDQNLGSQELFRTKRQF